MQVASKHFFEAAAVQLEDVSERRGDGAMTASLGVALRDA
jgi:hypothetical protein